MRKRVFSGTPLAATIEVNAMRPSRFRLCVPAACAALAACGDVSGPTGWSLQSALITDLRVVRLDGAPVTGPLSPSDAVAIVIVSAGSSSCTRPGPITVDTVFTQIRLAVRDWVQTADTACTRDLRPYPRRLLHTFFEPGVWALRAVGQSDTVVRVTVGPGDASGWQTRPGLGIGLVVTLLNGDPLPRVLPQATPIAITITSAGSSTCSRPGSVLMTSQATSLSFDVTDWERVVLDPFLCTPDLRPLPRTLLHTLLVPGTHSIRALGTGGEIVVEVVVASTDG